MKASFEYGTAEIIWLKSNFKQICFKFLTKGVHSFRIFNRNRELIPNGWRSQEKARFRIFSVVLGTNICLETDDLRILEISKKCMSVVE